VAAAEEKSGVAERATHSSLIGCIMVAVVRTGDEYQAQIPGLLPPDQRRRLVQDAVPRYAPRWGEPPNDSVVAQFLADSARASEREQVRNGVLSIA
jgi:hypothetical protein